MRRRALIGLAVGLGVAALAVLLLVFINARDPYGGPIEPSGAV